MNKIYPREEKVIYHNINQNQATKKEEIMYTETTYKIGEAKETIKLLNNLKVKKDDRDSLVSYLESFDPSNFDSYDFINLIRNLVNYHQNPLTNNEDLVAVVDAIDSSYKYVINNTKYAIKNTEYAIKTTEYTIKNTKYIINNATALEDKLAALENNLAALQYKLAALEEYKKEFLEGIVEFFLKNDGDNNILNKCKNITSTLKWYDDNKQELPLKSIDNFKKKLWDQLGIGDDFKNENSILREILEKKQFKEGYKLITQLMALYLSGLVSEAEESIIMLKQYKKDFEKCEEAFCRNNGTLTLQEQEEKTKREAEERYKNAEKEKAEKEAEALQKELKVLRLDKEYTAGTLLFEDGKYHGALEHFKLVKAVRKTNKINSIIKETEEKIKIAEKIITEIKKGEAYLESKKYEEALNKFKEAKAEASSIWKEDQGEMPALSKLTEYAINVKIESDIGKIFDLLKKGSIKEAYDFFDRSFDFLEEYSFGYQGKFDTKVNAFQEAFCDAKQGYELLAAIKEQIAEIQENKNAFELRKNEGNAKQAKFKLDNITNKLKTCEKLFREGEKLDLGQISKKLFDNYIAEAEKEKNNWEQIYRTFVPDLDKLHHIDEIEQNLEQAKYFCTNKEYGKALKKYTLASEMYEDLSEDKVSLSLFKNIVYENKGAKQIEKLLEKLTELIEVEEINNDMLKEAPNSYIKKIDNIKLKSFEDFASNYRKTDLRPLVKKAQKLAIAEEEVVAMLKYLDKHSEEEAEAFINKKIQSYITRGKSIKENVENILNEALEEGFYKDNEKLMHPVIKNFIEANDQRLEETFLEGSIEDIEEHHSNHENTNILGGGSEGET